MMSQIIELNGITKAFGNFRAVKNMSLSLEENKIYGLLGRNGAGKTTLMHLLTAQQFPTAGSVAVFGEDPYENSRVLSNVCFIKESQRYPDNYHVTDVMKLAPALFKYWDDLYANKLLKQFRVPLKRRMKQLSRGQLSAVGIVVGLASRAKLTIFDEPYLGLDAVSRGIFYDRLLEDYAQHPRTIILSTHLIDEVSKLLEHVILIDEGKLLLNETAETLRGSAFTIVGPKAQLKTFASGKEIIHQQEVGSFMSCTIQGVLSVQEKQEAMEIGLDVSPVSLQQLMVQLTGNDLEAEEAEQ